METAEQKIVSTLQELTQFINDGHKGYEHAAKETTNPQLRQLYQTLAGQRAEFAQELNEIIKNHGGTAQTSTTTKGKIFRQWIDAKAALTNRDDNNILSSNLYGEEWAQKAYNNALQQPDLPQPIRQLVERQKLALEQTYQTLQKLKDAD
ncbi:aldehyde dehydrogenase [Adhaeribacter arboris]|uniref:Aldehyde dehydrogenase n=1 Tax=Adhaeribacter arboris TaxID=2072846 RepID=A0A2T2YIU0_9BACT|nr:PA2169 family four-helix-bundle protein [Adhaeribacter arboris]PSR55420.1 aldehyde dehydrogenase [Adhaeribacter arboris]